MSNQRGLVISIAGAPFSIGSHSTLTGATGYAATVRPYILEVPPAQTLSISPEDGSFDAGGVSIRCRNLAELLTQFSSDPVASLVNEESRTSTTWDVNDTTGFTAGDIIFAGLEAIQIGGIVPGTPGQFTGLTRGTLGTNAQRMRPGQKVYSYMPTLEGRRVVCEWIDLQDGTRYQRYVGQVERVEFDGEEYVLTITSLLVGVSNRKVLSKQYAQGALLEELAANTTPDFFIRCDDKERLFVDNANTGYDTSFVIVGEEIIETPQLIYPAEENEISNVTSTYRLEVINNVDIQAGWLVDILDNSGNMVLEGVLCVARTLATATTVYLDFNTDITAASATDLVTANYHVLVPGLRTKRGRFGTEQQDHAAGASVDEIRILEGNQVDILLRLLFSDQGDGTNGPSSGKYDYYPPGWGLALPSSMVDLQELLDLQYERAEFRRYQKQESIELVEFLETMGMYCNTAIYWREDGACSATIHRDIYPRDSVGIPITTGNINWQSKPTASIDLALIRNFWEVKTDFTPQGDRYGHLITIEDSDSVDLRGQIPLEGADDLGLVKSVAEAQIYTAARSFLLLRSRPLLMIRASVFIDEPTPYRPGQIAQVQVPELPNLQGSEDVFSYFRVIEVSPSDGSGYQDLTLMQHPTDRRVGLVSLSGLVQSVGGGIVTLEPAATSHFSPTNPAWQPIGGDGTEDIHWFQMDDPIRFWDVSTFGPAAPTSQATTITSIDYVLRQFTPATVPGWLAAGDLVRLDDYATVKAGSTALERVDIFIAVADGILSPPTIDSDEAYVWGM